MKTRRIWGVLLALALLITTCPVPATVTRAETPAAPSVEPGHALLDYTYATTGGMKSETNGDHDYLTISQDVPDADLRQNGDDGYIRTEHKNGKVYVEYYDKDFLLLPDKSKTFDVELPKFGGVFYGERYNYIFSGNGEATSYGEWALQQYDTDWNFIKTEKKVYGSLVQNAIYAGTASFSEYGNTLFIHTCFRMHSGVWGDGQAHQGCIMILVEQDELLFELGYYFQGSHSFNQFVINDGEDLYTLDQADAAPRGLLLDRNALDDFEDMSRTDFFHFKGEWGANQTGATVGGFDFAGDRILTVVSSYDQDPDVISAQQYNIGVFSHSKDFSEYKEVWLTDYEPLYANHKDYVKVGNPYLVTTDTEYSYVLWEEYRDPIKFRTVRIAKIDKYGNPVGDIHSIVGRLSSNRPFYEDGHLIWYTTGTIYGDTGPIFYKLDVEQVLAGEYDYWDFVDISDFPVELEGYDYPYDPVKKPTPAVTSLIFEEKGYSLVEGLDYTVTYDNIRLGKATATITGTGGDYGGLFVGSITVEYNIHNASIADWELRLNPATVTFDPLAFYHATPKYTVYNADGELDQNITGTFSSEPGGSMWAAGTNTYYFTTNRYGFEGTISADFVIEPYPAEKLKVSLQFTEAKYSGKEIKPNVRVAYVNSVGNSRTVEKVQEHGSKTYTNYTVTYRDNVNPGIATATVVFEGNYTGTVELTFVIKGEGSDGLGDVDGDGQITSTDARLVLQFYAGKIKENNLNTAVADVDGDKQITSTDARLILQYYAGKIEDFPI